MSAREQTMFPVWERNEHGDHELYAPDGKLLGGCQLTGGVWRVFDHEELTIAFRVGLTAAKELVEERCVS